MFFVDDYSVCPSPLPLVAPFSFDAFFDFDAFLDFFTAPSQRVEPHFVHLIDFLLFVMT